MHERQKAMNIRKALEEEATFEYSDEELKMVELEQEEQLMNATVELTQEWREAKASKRNTKHN